MDPVSRLGNLVGIPQNSAIIPILDLSPPEFPLEFHFFNRKTCSHQFGTRSHQFGILSRLDYSDFMHQKMFLLFLIVASKVVTQ
jgi:hypothetical protein